jgi:hypothetical protein
VYFVGYFTKQKKPHSSSVHEFRLLSITFMQKFVMAIKLKQPEIYWFGIFTSFSGVIE